MTVIEMLYPLETSIYIRESFGKVRRFHLNFSFQFKSFKQATRELILTEKGEKLLEIKLSFKFASLN